MGEGDLIVHDEFVHNSAVVGTRLSGATSFSFHHNDLESMDVILRKIRPQHRNALIIIEGLYSTEGDIPDLRRAVELKKRFG